MYISYIYTLMQCFSNTGSLIDRTTKVFAWRLCQQSSYFSSPPPPPPPLTKRNVYWFTCTEQKGPGKGYIGHPSVLVP